MPSKPKEGSLSVGRLVFAKRTVYVSLREGTVRVKRGEMPSVAIELEEGQVLRSLDWSMTLRSQLDSSRKTIEYTWYATIESDKKPAKKPKAARKRRKA